MKHSLLITILFIVTSQALYGQPQSNSQQQTAPPQEAVVQWEDYIDTFADLMNLHRALNRSLGARDRRIKVLLEDISRDISFLRAEWRGNAGSESPATYKASLEVNVALMSEVVKKKLPPKKALPVLQDVRDDLRVKAEDCRLNPQGWDALVEFTVHTKQAMQPVSGYEVWFVPKGWADKPEKWARFSSLSSPTAKPLAPGRYMIRLKKESATAPEPVTVGGEGKPKQDHDMRVP